MRKVLIPFASTKLADISPTLVHFVREGHIRKLIANNLLPIYVSHLESRSIVLEKYNEADGVYFAGGNDIQPYLYNELDHPKNGLKDSGRDDLELLLLEKTLSDKKPFMGICRGLQMLAIASGGTLHQHIPDLSTQIQHDISYDFMHKNSHKIIIDQTSKTYQILKKKQLFIPSGHHQSVKTLGKKLRIGATAPDGIIEIVEHEDLDYFCYGIQGHPEIVDSEFDVFFKEFAKALN